MATILVEVSGGLAKVGTSPRRSKVEVVDLDQLREGAYEDVHRYWNDSLSVRARKYVKTNYPDIARHFDA
jgi:hypothetical protein